MPDLFPLAPESIQAFLMVFTRVSASLAFMPVIGGQGIPRQARAGLAVFVSAVIFPLVDTTSVRVDVDMLVMGGMIAGEAMIGLMTALIVTLVFSGVQLAGAVIGFQVGFGIVNVVDPVTSAQVSITSQFLNIFAVLLFLTFNMHHLLLNGVAQSFALAPLGGFAPDRKLLDLVMDATAASFLVGAQIAAPVTMILLLKQAAMGLIARTIPQINIFIVGFPLTIAFGLFVMALTLSPLSVYLFKIFSRMVSQVGIAYHLMG